jgi:4-amino-4-deoxy-L-arabinose transferase-like glycosyltransferase
LALLATLPQGLFRDEAFNIFDERALTWQLHPIFFPANEGREPLFLYWQNVFLLALGVSTFTFRLASVTIGMLTIALQIAVTRRLFGTRVGVVAGFVFATLYCAVQASRLGLRFNTVPLFTLLLIYALDWAVQRPHPYRFIFPGLVVGLALYSYTAAFALPLVVVGALAYIVMTRVGAWKQWIAGACMSAATAFLVAAPLLVYLLGHMRALYRLYDAGLVDPQATTSHNFLATWHNLLAYAGALSIVGDQEWRVNIPGRPIFDPVMSIFFYAGLILLLWTVVHQHAAKQSQDSRFPALLCLLSLVAILLPGLLSGGAPYYQRIFGLVPVLAIAPAVAIASVWRWMSKFRWRALVAPALSLPLMLQTVLSTHDYFGVWARQPEATTAQQYNSGATILANFLRGLPSGADVQIATGDEVVVKALAPDNVKYVDWFHVRQALPMPSRSAADTYYLLDLNDASYQEAPTMLEAQLRLHATQVFRGVDVNTGREVARAYRVPADNNLDALLPPGPQVDFGQRIAITGASVEPVLSATGLFNVMLGIKVLRDDPGDLSVSVRAIDDAGNVWGQTDSLGIDTLAWHKNQAALSVRDLHLYAGTPPGSLRLVARVYDLISGTVFNRDDGQGQAYEIGVLAVPTIVPDIDGTWSPPHIVHPAQLGSSVQLNGYHIDADHFPQHALGHVDLLWTCLQRAETGTRLVLDVVDAKGGIQSTLTSGNGLAAPPPDQCSPGQEVLDRRFVMVRGRWPAGAYAVQVALIDPTGKRLSSSVISPFRVDALPRSTAVPPTGQRVDATFADGIELLGVKVTSLDQGLGCTLVWRAIGDPVTNYTVFAHVLGADGKLVSQQDGPPDEGMWPTGDWITGQVVTDLHVVRFQQATLKPGMTLEVGLYEPATGKRLTILQAGSALVRDNALRIPLAS